MSNELIAALAGALIAVVGAWLVGGQQIRADRKDARKQTVNQAVNDLWLAADRLWESTQAVADFALEITAQRGAQQTPISPELHPMLRNAQAEKSAALAQTRHALARLRISQADSELLSKAQHLVDRSGTSKRTLENPEDAENVQARTAALGDFEKSAAASLV